MTFDPRHPLGQGFIEAVQVSLDRFYETQRALLGLTEDRIDLLWAQAQLFARGGKRIRPAFCYWAYVAVSNEDSSGVMDVAASLDLLHMFALVHDDVIDGSDTRRSNPSAHRFYERYHREAGWLGDSAAFGRSAAILLGDVLFAWSVSMVEEADIAPERLERARPFLDAVRTEVLAGQFLDLLHETKPLDPIAVIEDAQMIMEFKTSKYTVARPVQVGAALGLASDETLAGLGVFGTHVGRAFQMRDDLLGIFGDSSITGKPSGDDLRSGKKTTLIGYALRDSSPQDRTSLIQMLGDPHLTQADIDDARRILIDSGAVEATEEAITGEAAASLTCLESLDLSADGTQALLGLVQACVERTA